MMDHFNHILPPAILGEIEKSTVALGFNMASEYKTGALLRSLVASKPGGRFLELGTGTGFGTAWMMDGMDSHSTLLTIDNDPSVSAVAAKYLGKDPRLTIEVVDATSRLPNLDHRSFDLIFADAWVGKFEQLPNTISILKPGGILVLDDLLPQPNWPENHEPRIPKLVDQLYSYPELAITPLAWASGLIVATRRY
jgi:predicted O-methyltransferase YrrM